MGHRHSSLLRVAVTLAGGLTLGFPVAMLLALAAFSAGTSVVVAASCPSATGATLAGGTIAVGVGAGGTVVGATEYGGPGDPGSGHVGASGVDLDANPDSFAELGGVTFATADALGGLPYGTALRISYGNRSVIAYKRDFGLGGGPIDGHPRVIDLWWQLAVALGIPYLDGRWSGLVRLQAVAQGGASSVLGEPTSTAVDIAEPAGTTDAADGAAGSDTVADDDDDDANAGCASAGAGSGGGGGVVLNPGPVAKLLPDGQASAPSGAPLAVLGIIAAGNQIAGVPYVYGGGHGLPLDEIAAGYDCSSSVSHLLWGGGLLAASTDMVAADYETWGEPGPGRWVTIYASADHVFMYVAGLRWDTHNAAGPDDGSSGIGWHPLVREDEGFVVRHPAGL